MITKNPTALAKALVVSSTLVALAMSVVFGGGAGAIPASSGADGPPSVEGLSLSGPPVVAPGGTLPFVGFCRRETGVTEATVRAVQVVTPGADAVEIAVTLAVDGSGNLFGGIRIPVDVPVGQYRLELTCAYPSGVPNRAGEIFRVEGAATTTTSTTPQRPQPRIVEAPPAAPRSANARFTG